MGRSFYIITALIGFLTGVGLYLVWQPELVFVGYFLIFIFGFLFALVFHQCRRDAGIALSDGLMGGRGNVSALSERWGRRRSGRGCETALSATRVGFLFLLFVFLGLGRGILSEHHVAPNQIDYYNEQKVEVVGVIKEVDVRRDKAKYKIKIIEGEDVYTHLRGTVLITLSKYPQYHYGDRVKIYGELQEPGEFNGFNYGNYLSRYGVYSVMYYPYIDVLETGQGNVLWSSMMWMQTKFMNAINPPFMKRF